MLDIVFLIVLGVIWTAIASIQDLRNREVANWLSFSLIIFALGFRFFWCLFNGNSFAFFYQGLIGFGIFLVLGNLFYYTRLFAGGDAKLMIALGAILPFNEQFINNLTIFLVFFFIFLFIGMVYGLIWSVYLSLRNFNNFKKELKRQFLFRKTLFYIITLLGLFFIVFGFFDVFLLPAGIFILVFPYVYIYAKAVDEACMIKKINPNKLTEGDWLYKDIQFGKILIKANWEGLNEEEIKLLKKGKKQVLIRQGIPFIPVFFLSFVVLILWYSLWKPEFLFFLF